MAVVAKPEQRVRGASLTEGGTIGGEPASAPFILSLLFCQPGGQDIGERLHEELTCWSEPRRGAQPSGGGNSLAHLCQCFSRSWRRPCVQLCQACGACGLRELSVRLVQRVILQQWKI